MAAGKVVVRVAEKVAEKAAVKVAVTTVAVAAAATTSDPLPQLVVLEAATAMLLPLASLTADRALTRVVVVTTTALTVSSPANQGRNQAVLS